MAGFIPIAIIGIGCRFPGGVKNPDDFWTIISEGRCTWSDVPPERFNWRAYHHDDPEMSGTTNHRGGHFLEQDVAAFDARFFGISAAEAVGIDPQFRIQLETTYEALESAGIPVEKIRGSNTAVYMATFNHDYENIIYRDLTELPKYAMTGTGQALAANRISYAFDLHGPSVSLDTGCSGSLVAMHQACQSLRAGESDMALVGGTNLIMSPEVFSPMSNLHVLNKDGKCYSFDSRGEGYGRGEGGGTILMKRLDDALAAGDPIRAVVKNTACNQDGRTNGITFPSSKAQEDLMRFAYSSAGLDPDDTGYFEAHGTGTIAGDKAEIDAIGRVFVNHDLERPLYVGSVKGNIGHLENASGIAGVIKAVLVLQKGQIPPTANLDILKPELDLKNGRIKILKKLESESLPGLRRASVNSFGYGGTNTHAILESHPAKTKSKIETITNVMNNNLDMVLVDTSLADHDDHASKPLEDNDADNDVRNVNENGYRMWTHEAAPTFDNITHKANGFRVASKDSLHPRLFVLTAKSQNSLSAVIDGMQKWISGHRDSNVCLANLEYTLSLRRSIMPWRVACVASTVQDLEHALSTKNRPTKKSISAPSVTFLMSGQGAQYPGMTRHLCLTQSKFTESLQQSKRILTQLGAPWCLIEEILAETPNSRMHESQIAQIASTAVQIALIDLLESFGIKPNAVLGHSSGEIAAAYAVGALSHESAIKVSYHRSFLAQRSRSILKSKGAMLAVGLGERKVLEGYPLIFQTGTIVVACVNSPSSTTISGDETDVLELKEALDRDSVFNRLLKVDTAYHSHHMRAVSGEYMDSLNGLETSGADPTIQFFSSVTGDQKSADFGLSYWVENLVSQVKFSDALANLCSKQQLTSRKGGPSGSSLFIEIGPHSTLAGPFRQTVANLGLTKFTPQYFPSLVRNEKSVYQVLKVLGSIFEEGCSLNFDAVGALAQTTAREVITDLPPYPWDHSTMYWSESRLSKEHRFRKSPYHNLLGLRVAGSTTLEPIWRHNIDVERHAWLRDHVVNGLAIFPAASYLCMVIQAMQQLFAEKNQQEQILNYILKNVTFSQALVVPEGPGKIELQLSLIASVEGNVQSTSGWREFLITSISTDGSCTENCRGSIRVELKTAINEVEGNREKEHVMEFELRRLDDGRARSSKTIDSQALYAELKSLGNSYGQHFAAIREYNFDDEHKTAHGTVLIPNVTSSISSNSKENPHVIHPTTLDAFLHSTIPLYSRSCAQGSVVTVSIEELIVSAHILHAPGQELLWVTDVLPQGTNSAVCNVTAFQDAESKEKPFLSISNLVIQGISRISNSASSTAQNRHMCYKMEWGVDVDSITSLNTDRVVKSKDGLTPKEKLDLLDIAAAIYIDSCLKNINITEDDLSHSTPELLAFHRWAITFQDSDYGRSLISGMLEAEKKSILAEAQQAGIEGQSVCLVGSNLEHILTGTMNSLSLLLHHDLLYRLYADESSSLCYLHLINYMKSLVFINPRMKVLELGSGTGGLTLPLLEALDDHGSLALESYEFTDVSTVFFENAKEKFEKWDRFLQFKVLNIEADMVDQCFVEGTYDVIVASNVLHISRSIENTLKSVRRLLKPGGRLLIIETIRVIPFYNLLFGTMPGWWIGFNDGRQDSPLLSTEKWNDTLLRSSFEGVEVVAYDYDGPERTKAMMVSHPAKDLVLPLNQRVEIISTEQAKPKYLAFTETLLFNLKSQDLHCNLSLWPLEKLDLDTTYIVIDDGDNPILKDISEAHFESIKMLMNGRNVLWITIQDDSALANPEKHLIRGFTRTARIENKELFVVTLDAQQTEGLVQKISKVLRDSFFSKTEKVAREREYVFQDGKLLIPRLLPNITVDTRLQASDNAPPEMELGLFQQPKRPLRLHIGQLGGVNDLYFVDDLSITGALPADELEIRVTNYGLNIDDVDLALGQKTTGMVIEYAGVVVAIGSDYEDSYKIGEHVCGLAATPYASYVRVKDHNAHHLPNAIPLTLGAAIPLAFSTAYYALVEIGHLQRGQTVLIHSAAAAIGQAAIQIAQHITSSEMIFATVETVEDKRSLTENYNLSEDQIFSSQLKTFRKGILRITKLAGVDMILNCSSSNALEDTWACIANFGILVQIGSGSTLPKYLPPRNFTYSAFDMVDVARERPDSIKRIMTQVLSLFEVGIFKPVIPIKVLAISEIGDAFKLIQARNSSAKIVLEADEESFVPIAKPKNNLHLEANGTYVVAGGTGGLGLEIARLMAAKGAKHLVLLSRRTMSNADNHALEEEFSLLGAEVRIVCCDITSQSQVKELALALESSMPPVRGVVQSAMVLKDRLLDHMTASEFAIPLQAKVNGTEHLIEAFSSPRLDFFIMLSSLVSILGNSAQANYAAGNSYLDAIAETQSHSHTHFMSLNLGAMADVGVVAETPRLGQYLVRQGYILVKLSELLSVLTYAMSAEAKNDDCHQIILGFNRTSMMESDNNFMLENPMLNHLPLPTIPESISTQVTVRQSIEESIANAGDEDEVKMVIANAMAMKISALLSLEAESIDLNGPLREFGLDSLVLIEIRHWIADKLKKVLSVVQILDASSLVALAEIIAKKG